MGYDRRTFLKQALGATGAGLAVPLLAACSPSAAPTSTAQPVPPGTPNVAPLAAKGVTRVSCGFASINPYQLVPIVGNEKPELAGAFGIEFDLVTTTNAPNALNALIGGSVDTAIATPDASWAAQDKAPDVKQLLALANGTPYVLIAQPEITRVADLKGMTVGASAIRGGADTTALRVMLAENGLKDTDYTIVQAGAVAEKSAAMKARTVQAVAQLEPQATLLRDEGFKELDNANNYPPLKNVHSTLLVSRTSWYQARSDVAVGLVRAWDAITRWLYDAANKDEVLALINKTMNVGDRAAQNAYNLHIGQQVVAQDLHIKEVFMQQFIDNQKKAGGENLPTDPMKYVDASVLDKALRM